MRLANTSRTYGIIRAVYVDGVESVADETGVASVVTFDIEVETPGGTVFLEKSGTYVPVPPDSDYEVLAGPAVYRDKLVDVIESDREFWPMIPVFPAYEDCSA